MTSAVLDTRPSLTPNTPARSAPDRSPRCHGSRRRTWARGSGRPPSIRRASVRAWPRSSAAMPGPASGSASYIPASARSARSISGSTVPTDSRFAAWPSSRVRRLGPPGAGTRAPASRSLPSQCAACLSSIEASSRKISSRSPVSASARRVYSAAASRSLASMSRQRLTESERCGVISLVVMCLVTTEPDGSLCRSTPHVSPASVTARPARASPRRALEPRLSRRWRRRSRSRSPGTAGAGSATPRPAGSSGSWSAPRPGRCTRTCPDRRPSRRCRPTWPPRSAR